MPRPLELANRIAVDHDGERFHIIIHRPVYGEISFTCADPQYIRGVVHDMHDAFECPMPPLWLCGEKATAPQETTQGEL